MIGPLRSGVGTWLRSQLQQRLGQRRFGRDAPEGGRFGLTLSFVEFNPERSYRSRFGARIYPSNSSGEGWAAVPFVVILRSYITSGSKAERRGRDHAPDLDHKGWLA